MEIKSSIESVRDFAVDCLLASKLMCAQVIEKVDRKWADRCNNPDDEYPLQD